MNYSTPQQEQDRPVFTRGGTRKTEYYPYYNHSNQDIESYHAPMSTAPPGQRASMDDDF